MKQHKKIKDKCDICGKWMDNYKLYRDSENEIICVCENCVKYLDIDNKVEIVRKDGTVIFQTKLF